MFDIPRWAIANDTEGRDGARKDGRRDRDSSSATSVVLIVNWFVFGVCHMMKEAVEAAKLALHTVCGFG